MKATEQFCTVVLFIMLYKMVLTFESVDEILKCDLNIQMKVIEQSLLVVLFIMLYQVVSTYKSVYEILKCVSCGTVYNQTGYVKNNFIRETVLSAHITRENELQSLLHVIMTMNDDDDKKKENEGGNDDDDDDIGD